jgi:hypothetical protein
MQMPVIVGVGIVLAFLVTFSQWFYAFGSGMREAVLDDARFAFRIVRASVLSIIFMVFVFFIIAMINECPDKPSQRSEFLENLNCEKYLQIKSTSENLFKKSF